MRAVRYHEAGPPDVLQLEDIPRPEPTKDEVLLEVRAAGVNPTDAKRRKRGSVAMPKVPGSDFAGVVREVGDRVSEYEPGDRVFGTGLHIDRFRQGSLAEYIAVSPKLLTTLPPNVDFETGGAIGIVGSTAWWALVDHAATDAADSVLIHGGQGGVGHVAVQLASVVGDTVFATVGAEDQRAVVERLGADVTINYRTEDISAAVEETAPEGVDVIVDHYLNEYFQTDVDIAAFDADLVAIAGNTGQLSDASPARSKNLTVHFASMSNIVLNDHAPDICTILEKIATLLERGDLSVEITKTYPLEEASKAHRTVMEESYVGKVVVTL